jgi:hypothetical protein
MSSLAQVVRMSATQNRGASDMAKHLARPCTAYNPLPRQPHDSMLQYRFLVGQGNVVHSNGLHVSQLLQLNLSARHLPVLLLCTSVVAIAVSF